jgi:hypothetical protein
MLITSYKITQLHNPEDCDAQGDKTPIQLVPLKKASPFLGSSTSKNGKCQGTSLHMIPDHYQNLCNYILNVHVLSIEDE